MGPRGLWACLLHATISGSPPSSHSSRSSRSTGLPLCFSQGVPKHPRPVSLFPTLPSGSAPHLPLWTFPLFLGLYDFLVLRHGLFSSARPPSPSPPCTFSLSWAGNFLCLICAPHQPCLLKSSSFFTFKSPLKCLALWEIFPNLSKQRDRLSQLGPETQAAGLLPHVLYLPACAG